MQILQMILLRSFLTLQENLEYLIALVLQAGQIRQSPLSIGFLWTPLLIVKFFSGRLKYQSFSSWTPSYLLNVNKFLVKISQLEFLVLTKKYIFVVYLFINFFCLFFFFFVFVKLQPILKKVFYFLWIFTFFVNHLICTSNVLLVNLSNFLMLYGLKLRLN